MFTGTCINYTLVFSLQFERFVTVSKFSKIFKTKTVQMLKHKLCKGSGIYNSTQSQDYQTSWL